MGVIAMLSAILILAALPWLDTSKIRSAVFRPLVQTVLLDIGSRCINPWIMLGAMPAEGLIFINCQSSYGLLLYSFFNNFTFTRI